MRIDGRSRNVSASRSGESSKRSVCHDVVTAKVVSGVGESSPLSMVWSSS
jgi:hypothetical protein